MLAFRSARPVNGNLGNGSPNGVCNVNITRTLRGKPATAMDLVFLSGFVRKCDFHHCPDGVSVGFGPNQLERKAFSSRVDSRELISQEPYPWFGEVNLDHVHPSVLVVVEQCESSPILPSVRSTDLRNADEVSVLRQEELIAFFAAE